MSAKNSRTSSARAASKLKRMPDAAIDYTDIPALDDEFFRTAKLLMPVEKKPVSLRLDADVIEWFRQTGSGYQSRMNAVLRAYMSAQSKRSRAS